MKQFFDLVVVMPIGPNSEPDFIFDTINSIIYYIGCSYKIIIADDSQVGTGLKVQQRFSDIDLISTSKNYGLHGGLYISLSLAYRHAIEHYHFSALFRIDADALVIASQPEKEAIDLFKNNSNIGMAGQYGFQYDGTPWDLAWPRQRIINGTSTWKAINRPIANWVLRKLYKKALANGYITGESVFGGAYFISEPCL